MNAPIPESTTSHPSIQSGWPPEKDFSTQTLVQASEIRKINLNTTFLVFRLFSPVSFNRRNHICFQQKKTQKTVVGKFCAVDFGQVKSKKK